MANPTVSQTVANAMNEIGKLSEEQLQEQLLHHLGQAAAIRKMIAMVRAQGKAGKKPAVRRRRTATVLPAEPAATVNLADSL